MLLSIFIKFSLLFTLDDIKYQIKFNIVLVQFPDNDENQERQQFGLTGSFY